MFEYLKDFLEKKPKLEKEISKRDIVKQTENGLWLKQIERDEKGRLVYERKREFKNPQEPKEDEIKYDYEKRFGYDAEGNLIKEEGKSFDHGNGWKKEFISEDGRFIKEIGEVIDGPNQGHKWRKEFSYDDEEKMTLEEGEILEQGINLGKEPKGHAWRKKHFYENEKWVGETGEITSGPEKGKIWAKGKIPKQELKAI